VLEEVEFVVNESSVEFTHAVRVSKKIRARVGQIIAGTVRNVMRDFDFFHLIAVDGVRTEIARDG
jgi:hypothetical protein